MVATVAVLLDEGWVSRLCVVVVVVVEEEEVTPSTTTNLSVNHILVWQLDVTPQRHSRARNLHNQVREAEDISKFVCTLICCHE